MKLYEISYVDTDNNDTTVIYTEAEIIEEYWHYWSAKMVGKFGNDNPVITIENCIQDWITVNWAIEIGIPI